jgi:TonB family protein
MKRSLFLLFAVICALNLCAHADQMQDDLAREWKNKIVIIRDFPQDGHITFRSDGTPAHDLHRGYWSLNGMAQITKMSLKGDKLRLSGPRIINLFDKNTGKFANFITKTQIELDLELDPAWQDAKAVDTVLNKAFVSASELAALVPDYWVPCLKGTHLVKTKNEKPDQWFCGPAAKAGDNGSAEATPAASSAETGAAVSPAPESNPVTPRKGDAPSEVAVDQVAATPGPETTASDVGKSPAGEAIGEKPFRVGKHVAPPKALFTPDPSYPEFARQTRIQGSTLLWLVVNREGRPEHIRVARPLGAGFDDKAVEAVQRWKFQPGTFDGKPVPVQINVEVNFRLYNSPVNAGNYRYKP